MLSTEYLVVKYKFGKDVWFNVAEETDFLPIVFKTLLCNVFSY